MNSGGYETVIGLEVHVHLKTQTKMFCRCRNLFGAQPNTHVCPVCTGQPGVLPVANGKAIEQAARAGLALGCRINSESVFARKQYFYPDLPKNYQISQYERPIAEKGHIMLGDRKINITRAHLEEDAGKLIHAESDVSLVDYNRTGTPLLEIVSEPEIDSPQEAAEYLKELRQVLRYCGISDCDMEKGSMRCDANVSLRKKGSKELGVKTELKNMNSFKAVEKALEYEIKRQEKVLGEGGRITQETRLWNEDKGTTRSMRSKEEAHDYRYFPEPDLPRLVIEAEKIKSIRDSIPELPAARRRRYIVQTGLSEYDAGVLTQEKEISDYFDAACGMLGDKSSENIKKLANWITVELLGKLNAEGSGFREDVISPPHMAELVGYIGAGTISGKMGKDIFEIMYNKGVSPGEVIREKGLKQITDGDQISAVCREVIESSPDIVDKYMQGKDGVLGVLVGNVMKKTRGQANPAMVNAKLRELMGRRQ
ncbi:MAG: Asp-tRNA(Asn)/Glu-tRNA(Gln) amidotransferase subunit GatB [Elusimicrobia bacterium]|nr:Asp-tRNA(Asn)/Glu-tRNA(Gln) amidotransferase subunit GatB [Elusimicrobiota bacterium]